MAYPARELITRAYYLSGIASRQFQTVSGQQLSDGMFLLNDLLAMSTTDAGIIPYISKYSLTTVAGQDEYDIPGLIYPETMTYYIGSVRFLSRQLNRDKFFGNTKPDVSLMPYNHRFERTVDGCKLYLYFKADTAYPIEIFGKFGMDEVATPDVDMSLVYDRRFLEYLRYSLAEMICHENDSELSPSVLEKKKLLTNKISEANPIDLTMKKLSSLSGSGGYGDIRIYGPLMGGWTP